MVTRVEDRPESKHKFAVFKEFKTLDTQAKRTGLPQGHFSWLENLMPIGDGYLPAVPGPSTVIATITG